jgi:putative ABC transport system substrate-binding protein
MRRRDFIAGLGSAVASPLAARAQRGERMRRIGVLSPYAENDQETKYGLSVFKQGLAELGWTDGGNLRMDVRWAAGNVDRVRVYAKELVDLQPDVILADGTPQTAALQRETKTIPIVFVVVADPVGSGFVAGLPRAVPVGPIGPLAQGQEPGQPRHDAASGRPVGQLYVAEIRPITMLACSKKGRP